MSQLICVFDTETTGFPNFKAPSDHPDQPHIVDICALLYTPEGDLVDSFEAMVRPDGWSIPNEVSVIHGITNEMALEHLKRTAADKPGSHIAGYLDVIQLLEQGQ